MLKSRQALMASSFAVAAMGLVGVALLLVRPGPSARASQAWTRTPVITAPLVDASGQAVVRRAVMKAWQLVPTEMTPTVRRRDDLTRQTRPLLWWGFPDAVKSGGRTSGVYPTRLTIWKLLPPFRNLAAFSALLPGVWKRADMVREHGRFVMEHADHRPIRVTLRSRLQTELGPLAGSGAILVVSRTGDVWALSGSAVSLTRPRQLGLAELPVLLAWALATPQGHQLTASGAPRLESVASWWTRQRAREALAALNLPRPRQLEGVAPSSLVDALEGYAAAPPLTVADSYLPFVDEGRLPRPTLEVAAGAKGGRPVPGRWSTVLAGLPALTVHGLSFRVWDPAGNWTVIIAPRPGVVALLVGRAGANATAVMQCLSRALTG
ncbi:MAG: hypothetical protein OWU84_02250 [Firmicutes bacterium]|nr:hypothetical protein [Bacillota bacterium]